MQRVFGIILGTLLLALGNPGTVHAQLKDYEACTANNACASKHCGGGGRCIPAALLGAGRVCDTAADCQSHACLVTTEGTKVCSASPKASASALQRTLVNGEICKAAAECQSGICVNRSPYPNLCAATKLQVGVYCVSDSECLFGRCAASASGSSKKYCALPGAGLTPLASPATRAQDYEPCDQDNQCASNVCGWASAAKKQKRCIPKNKLPSGLACHDSANCATGACIMAGTQADMVCR